MSTTRALLTLVLVGPACSAQQLSIGGGEPLELEDVDAVPTGHASGTDASGGYLFTAFEISHCECRSGDASSFGCGYPWELGADGLWLDQQDGALTATLIRSNELDPSLVLHGGIESDGSFEIGAAFDVVDFDSTIGQAYNLATGVVDPLKSIDSTWNIRAQYVDGSTSFDCDVTAELELVYWPVESQGECIGDSDCHPAAPYCSDNVCSAGSDGASCIFDDDCQSDHCVDGTCTGGGVSDACSFDTDCASGLCGDDGVCVPPGGCSDLSPCADPMQICYDNMCQDGAEGDGCDNPLHCGPELTCVAGTCYDGSEGDPCESPTDCEFDSPNCVMGTCYDGSAGDPCDSAVDCDLAAGLDCGPSGVCE